MATLIERSICSSRFLKYIFRIKPCTTMYFCTKPAKHFTGVLLQNRGHIDVFGEDSVKFLQGLLTNDINLFHCDSLMNALYAMILNTKGRVLYDVILYKQERDTPGFLIECDLKAVGNILKTFTPYKLRSKVDFNDVTDQFNSWAIMEEEAVAHLKHIHADSDDIILVKDPRIAALGARLVLPKNKGAAEYFSNVEEISDQDVYDKHRVRLGVGEGMKDIEPGAPMPLEYNITDQHGVSFQKGCYIGQELTARTYHTGVIRKRLMPVSIMQSSSDQQLHIDKGASITTTSGKRAGKLISAYDNIGLALMRLDVVKSDTELKIVMADHEVAGVSVNWPTWWSVE